MTRITVAIATWNRAKLLDQTLTQMHKLFIPADVEWELLVVHNSTDDTDAVIRRHADILPIRRVVEPAPGVSIARNCAGAEARGELIIWTDDDVLVNPEWLAAYHEAARRWPDAGYFGGLIEPWFECTPPAWMLENRKLLQGALACRDFGPDEHYLSENEPPFTANAAIRTEIFKKHGFDPNLGGKKDSGYMAEDVQMMETLRSHGVRGVWVPRASVRHFVVKERLNRGHVWTHFYRNGRTDVYLERASQEGKKWGGVPRYLFRELAENWAVAHWKRLWLRSDWLLFHIRAARSSGMIAEFFHLAKQGALRAG